MTTLQEFEAWYSENTFMEDGMWKTAQKTWQHQQAKIDELKAEKEKLIQWVAQLGVECRRLGVHVTIEGLDYAATLRGMK